MGNFESVFGGVVSEGTLRPQDLIDKLMATADALLDWRITAQGETYGGGHKPDHPLNVQSVGGYHDRLGAMERRMKSAGYYDSESALWDLDDLFNMLNEASPDGWAFCSLPGDGACFGFWKAQSDDGGENG